MCHTKLGEDRMTTGDLKGSEDAWREREHRVDENVIFMAGVLPPVCHRQVNSNLVRPVVWGQASTGELAASSYAERQRA